MRIIQKSLGMVLLFSVTLVFAQGTYDELKQKGSAEMLQGDYKSLRVTAESLLSDNSVDAQILGNYFMAESFRPEPEKRKQWGTKALKLSQEISNHYGIGLASKTLGGYYLRNYQLDSAKFFYTQSIGAFEEIGNEEARNQVEKLNFNLMIVAYRGSQFQEVVEIAIPVLEGIKQGEKLDFQYRITSLVGSTYAKIMESNSLDSMILA